ncbi:MAG: hypothetical protein IJP92_11890 [Lachnospiraceae bacterium]|nr:hypothetical protein [Lachnospiraceae bacterium]
MPGEQMPPPKKRGRKGTVIAIAALSAVLVAGIVVAIVLLIRSSGGPFKNAKKGDIIIFGSYEQDGNAANGKEPVEWYVLDVEEDSVLVVSRYVLDGVLYHDGYKHVTWENCTLRAWLNNDFYKEAFSAAEQEEIMESHVINRDNEFHGSPGGNDTRDKVFCLSVDEVYRYYPFNANHDEEGRRESEALIAEATPHASNHKVFTYEITTENYDRQLKASDYSEDCIGKRGASWWLRSSAYYDDSTENVIKSVTEGICFVGPYGDAGWNNIVHFTSDFLGVRPALRLRR